MEKNPLFKFWYSWVTKVCYSIYVACVQMCYCASFALCGWYWNHAFPVSRGSFVDRKVIQAHGTFWCLSKSLGIFWLLNRVSLGIVDYLCLQAQMILFTCNFTQSKKQTGRMNLISFYVGCLMQTSCCCCYRSMNASHRINDLIQ